MPGDEMATRFQRTPRVSLDNVPGSLPRAEIPDDVDLDDAVQWGIQQLRDFKSGSFTEGCVWRDLYALTGLPRTFYGTKQILSAWKEVSNIHQPSDFSLLPGTARISRLGPEYAWITARYSFETSGSLPSICSGQIGIVPDHESRWKIWHISTVLEHFQEFRSPDKFSDAREDLCNGVGHGVARKASEYTCCVVGAGFAGLCLSARLEALGVDYVTLDKNDRVGDNWRHRYRSATCEKITNRERFALF